MKSPRPLRWTKAALQPMRGHGAVSTSNRSMQNSSAIGGPSRSHQSR